MDWKKLIEEKQVSELSVHLHCPEERADLFSAFDGSSAEVETCEFLYSLVQILKPNKVLETGTATGIAAIAIASAMKANGFGKLYTIEKEKDLAEQAKKRIEKADLAKYVQVVNQDSLVFCKETTLKFKLAFFDSAIPIRTKEFALLYGKGLLDVVVFHDTSRLRERTFKVKEEPHGDYLAALHEAEKICVCGSIDFELSRGLRLMQVSGFVGETLQ